MNKIAAALSPLQQAGLEETEFRSANLVLREVPNTTVLRLRSLQPDLTAAALQQQGLEVPSSTGGSVGSDPGILCLRPGEWLVCSTSLSAGELITQLRASLPAGDAAGQAALLDLSDGMAVLQLSGAAAPWLLAKFSSLDFLGPRNSGLHCARTRMAQAAVVVNCHPLAARPAGCAYDLILDRSMARYLWDLLLHSAGHAEELLAGGSLR